MEEAPRRGVAVSFVVAVLAAVAVTGLAYGLLAGPVYILASIAPDGMETPALRNTLVVGMVVCTVVGVGAGVAAGLWAARGGRLPTDRTASPDR